MIASLGELAMRSGVDIFAVSKGEETANGGTSSQPTTALLDAWGGGKATTSGVRVNPDLAMQTSVINACVRVHSESVASLPFLTMRSKGKRKDRAEDHPLYRILHDQPNPWQTSFEWREMIARDLHTRGNGYSLIERNGRGDVTALYPLRASQVTILKGKDRRPFYRCSELEGSPVLSRENIFHVRGWTKDGYTGLSPIQEAMEAVGLTIAAEQFGASLFGNGANNRGFFIYNGVLKPGDYDRLRASLREKYVGQGKWNSVGLLDGNWKYEKTGMTAEEAQFLLTRGYQVEDLARLYRMPLPMIGHGDKAQTYASAEQFFLSFVVHTLRPQLVRWEQAIKRDLFTSNEGDMYAQLLVDGLLRGDIKSRYAAYATARQWGWMSADDVLELEDRNPLPDGKGQIYLTPMNMIEAGQAAAANGGSDQSAKLLNALAVLGEFMKANAGAIEAAGEEVANA